MVTKPLRIGIYGVSGVGKTTLTQRLEKYSHSVQVIDGSRVIDAVSEGGLAVFKRKSLQEKAKDRFRAIDYFQSVFVKAEKHLVIAGHYSFLKVDGFEDAWTDADADFYDVIFFLHKSPEAILLQCQSDVSRNRDFTLQQIEQWQVYEWQSLQAVCSANTIDLHQLNGDNSADSIERAFIEHISGLVIRKISKGIADSGYQSVVLCDCDGTLNHNDVYEFFHEGPVVDSVTAIFKQYPAYCHDAFIDVSNYLDFSITEPLIRKMVEDASRSLEINPVMLRTLRKLRNDGAVIVFVSCGFPKAWNSSAFQADVIIGGASFGSYGCLVTDQSKLLLAQLLVDQNLHVSAFGNGSVDIGMLNVSHKAHYVYSDQINPKHINRLEDHKDLHLIKLEGI
ncbi:ATP-binding protein [Endozoicomonas sp. 4G]|uniref:ATP-binding protein n=1 Tax=Endozoicomonas sp. 4G TaxID=2872754 RepID=UPI002078B70E|nr:ATP-binding protein [Endozoicomonas sp. 4G]